MGANKSNPNVLKLGKLGHIFVNKDPEFDIRFYIILPISWGCMSARWLVFCHREYEFIIKELWESKLKLNFIPTWWDLILIKVKVE